MYSYINPRNKPIVSKTAKIWIFFGFLILSGLLGYTAYLFSKTANIEKEIEVQNRTKETLTSSINSLEEEFRILKMKKILSSEIASSNLLLKKSVKNLFDLVPDQIRLERVVMKKDSLVIDGITSTKDAYRLLLESPLKSIFDESEVSFKFDGRIGRYRFKSINRMNSIQNRQILESGDGKK
jgi:Tfp pilus assembly protein PilN